MRYPEDERRPVMERFDDPYYERDRLYHDPDGEYLRRQHERELWELDLDRKLDSDSYLSERDYRDRDVHRREGII